MNNKNIIIKDLGIQHYNIIYKRMKNLIKDNLLNKRDEIWFLEHYPIFTNKNFRNSKIITNIHGIPCFETDRGGKITYHGPGQQIIYMMLNLNKFNIKLKNLIFFIEEIVIQTLKCLKIRSNRIKSLPGVYIKKKKICFIGLKIYRRFLYHGLALNVKMDLTPFKYIAPCGIKNIKVTQINDFLPNIKIQNVKKILQNKIFKILNLIK